jgi:trk system potassium uptake protein
MYIIVAGAGNLGKYIIDILAKENHDVVVVEKDEKVAQKIANELDVVTITGDAADPNVLKEAGIDQADIIVCVTSLDEINIVVGILAKQTGVKTVALTLSKINYEKEILDRLGIDIVIHPEAAAAGYISQLITEPSVLDLSFFSRGDAEIIELVINEKSKFLNKDLDFLKKKLPADTNIVGIFSNDKFFVPSKNITLKKTDKILIVSKKEKIKLVRKLK